MHRGNVVGTQTPTHREVWFITPVTEGVRNLHREKQRLLWVSAGCCAKSENPCRLHRAKKVVDFNSPTPKPIHRHPPIPFSALHPLTFSVDQAIYCIVGLSPQQCTSSRYKFQALWSTVWKKQSYETCFGACFLYLFSKIYYWIMAKVKLDDWWGQIQS